MEDFKEVVLTKEQYLNLTNKNKKLSCMVRNFSKVIKFLLLTYKLKESHRPMINNGKLHPFIKNLKIEKTC